MARPRVLVVDDEVGICQLVERALVPNGYEVQISHSAGTAVELAGTVPDVVIMDLRLPDMDGLSLLSQILDRWPQIAVIVMSGFATIESAVEAMRRGAFTYLTKPFGMEQLVLLVKRAIEGKRLVDENRSLRRRLADGYTKEALTGRSEAIQHVMHLIDRAAQTEARVLILGESGTGKELVAQAIHAASSRSSGAFVAVNCAAIPDPLLESELFGHEKGAFTGATGRKPGRFEQADGGTLFLDEIGDMSLVTQAKLLRVLQDNTVQHLGGVAPIHVDVRIIAATNKVLPDAVTSGNFRDDLFYRLNVLPIVMPPLRTRPEDIPLLAAHFLQKHSLQLGYGLQISDDVMQFLMQHSWPGNVRELENVIERCAVLCDDGTIGLDLVRSALGLVRPAGSGPPRIAPGMTLEQCERELITVTLLHTGGRRREAADLLGISIRTLQYKVKHYGVQ